MMLRWILVYSSTWVDHLSHLHQVLTALKHTGLVVNSKKSCFGRTAVQYLGFKVGSGKIWAVQDKVGVLAKAAPQLLARSYRASWDWAIITAALYPSSPPRSRLWLIFLREQSKRPNPSTFPQKRFRPFGTLRYPSVAKPFYTPHYPTSPSFFTQMLPAQGWALHWPNPPPLGSALLYISDGSSPLLNVNMLSLNEKLMPSGGLLSSLNTTCGAAASLWLRTMPCFNGWCAWRTLTPTSCGGIWCCNCIHLKCNTAGANTMLTLTFFLADHLGQHGAAGLPGLGVGVVVSLHGPPRHRLHDSNSDRTYNLTIHYFTGGKKETLHQIKNYILKWDGWACLLLTDSWNQSFIFEKCLVLSLYIIHFSPGYLNSCNTTWAATPPSSWPSSE